MPKPIGKWLSELSCNKEVLEKAIPTYTYAFRQSRFKENLVYTHKTTTNNILNKKQRNLKSFGSIQLIWLMKKNIDKKFLNFLKKYFPKKNKLHKIFNKSNIKISYNYMSNISSIIEEHNKSLLQPKITKCGCNCRVKNISPLQDQCQTSNLIYRADVENEVNDGKKIYFGLAARTFKERFNSSEIVKKGFNHK